MANKYIVIDEKTWNRAFLSHWRWYTQFAVDSEYERLSKLGVWFPTGESITYPFGIRNFYVADPEGNFLAIGSTNEI